MPENCTECGAALPEGGSCRDHFHALLLLEGEIPGVLGAIMHFYVVATYGLQHPHSMNYTSDALKGLRSMLADALDGRIAVRDIRRRGRSFLHARWRTTSRCCQSDCLSCSAAMCKKTRRRGKPDPAVLRDIVKWVVAAAQPGKIVLFGSAARGTMGPNSDIDLLVITGGKFNYWGVYHTIREQLRGTRVPIDLVLVTPEDVERYRGSHCLMICPALREGTLIYGS